MASLRKVPAPRPEPTRAASSAEVRFFRALNRVVEPMVRAGLGSPRIVPGGLIVLEHRGRVSGRLNRSPLVASRLGGYVLVATFRGARSQWVRNLAAHPSTQYWLAGQPRAVRAFVIHEGKRFRVPASFPYPLRVVSEILASYRKLGWAFAILSPRPVRPRRTPTKKPSLRSRRGAGAARSKSPKPSSGSSRRPPASG